MTNVPDHLQIKIGDLISQCQKVVGIETIKTIVEHIICEQLDRKLVSLDRKPALNHR